MVYTIHVAWDDEAKVWYVQDSNVPGLCIEAATLERMAERLAEIIPELLEANGVHPANDVPFELLAARHGIAHRRPA
jgi:hypothetical protein